MSDIQELVISLSKDGVLTLTMNRPEVHNAFDDFQIERINKVLIDAEKNNNVKIVVVAANGKSFSAGADLNYMKRMGEMTHEENLEDARKLANLMKTLNFLSKPTIAVVQGAVYGGGVGLVSCCDFAIGTKYAKFSLSEVRLGLVPATIGPYVIKTIGEKNARRLFLSAEVISAEEAVGLGFLNKVVEVEKLGDEVTNLCETLLQNSPEAMSHAKRLIFENTNKEITLPLIEQTCLNITKARESESGKEGMKAFLEKRKPNWIK